MLAPADGGLAGTEIVSWMEKKKKRTSDHQFHKALGFFSIPQHKAQRQAPGCFWSSEGGKSSEAVETKEKKNFQSSSLTQKKKTSDSP